MFTGIIETFGSIVNIKKEQENLHITLSSNITQELKIDQSIAHNGICLTVVAINKNEYTVTAIQETINKTNINKWKIGELINLERALKLGDYLDGHIVQGHVDQVGICKNIRESNGSYYFDFEYEKSTGNITIEKGSITVNGVSLTVVNSGINTFSVAIIPYTLKHTNFKNLRIGDEVNLEFDVLGKYITKLNSIK